MHTNSLTLKGPTRFYLVEWAPNPDPPYNGMVEISRSDITGFYPSFSKALSVVTNLKGDHKLPTPFEFYRTKRQLSHGRIMSTRFDSHGRQTLEGLTDGLIGGGSIARPLIQNAGISYNKALSNFNDSVRGGIDLSIDVAEAHQVKGLLRSLPPVRWGDTTWYTKDVRGTKWGRIAGLARAFSSASLKRKGEAWLAFTYGIKPLMMDIHESINEVVNPARPYWFRVRGRASNVITSTSYYVSGDDQSATDGNTFWSESEVQRCEIRCQLALADAATDLSRFTSLNPFSIAYELLPYSFVVDWFLNVGGYLRDLETSLISGTSFVDGYVTQSVKQVYERRQYGSTSFPNGGGDTWDYSDTFEHIWKKRTVLTEYPTPRIPRLNTHLGASRMLSAASLLSVLLKG